MRSPLSCFEERLPRIVTLCNSRQRASLHHLHVIEQRIERDIIQPHAIHEGQQHVVIEPNSATRPYTPLGSYTPKEREGFYVDRPEVEVIVSVVLVCQAPGCGRRLVPFRREQVCGSRL